LSSGTVVLGWQGSLSQMKLQKSLEQYQKIPKSAVMLHKIECQ